MADRTIQYKLGFDADTSKAKAQLKDLQNQLNQLANTALNKSNFDYSSEIGKSVKAVNELQTQLHQATNQKTGKLDLSKFNDSIKKSGKGLEYYQQQFSKLGTDGTKAFLSLTESIVNAEKPLHKTSKLLDEMKVSLANTVKWQLSSSAIHGFMGAIQGAYGYAQDLNKSLNDIRIVTGQSTDQMAEFAKQANNSAKALSTSTVKYAEAALIYYQQGLSDEQVKARTDTTIKMANVTGENAADVSSYMTAIWNNFAKGSDNLEYFSDVITALGAATAASSEEIAGGLEKFAAVGETVGLSYEYATAALTTIIDKTRQSEDVVGTALKTIFARIQGLQQGETAEDGVTLNKYSRALENVGIQIMDTSGELKSMDNILNELGQRWQTLSKAEQVALAQTVGGTRQYTQLIALMDNWESMQENLTTAYSSEGALQQQADIYAESWEGAQKRVQAAWEDIYDSILKDDFFIRLTNAIADVVNTIGDIIDAMGGAAGLISTFGMIFTQVFAKDIKKGMATAQSYINSFSGKTKEELKKIESDAVKLGTDMASRGGDSATSKVLRSKFNLYKMLNDSADKLTQEQFEQLQNELAINDALDQRLLATDKEIKQQEKLIESLQRRLIIDGGLSEDESKKLNDAKVKAKNVGAAQGFTDFLYDDINTLKNSGMLNNEETKGSASKNFKKSAGNMLGELEEKTKTLGNAEIDKIISNWSNIISSDDEITEAILGEFKDAIEKVKGYLAQEMPKIDDILSEESREKHSKNVGDIIETSADQGSSEASMRRDYLNKDNFNKNFQEEILNQSNQNAVIDLADKINLASQAFFTLTTIANAFSGVWKTINDPDLTGFEKFKAIVGLLIPMMPTLLMSLGSMSTALTGVAAAEGVAATGATILKAALDALMGPVGWAILAITALAGVFIYLADKMSVEGRLKEANKELEKTKTEAKELKDAYNDLKSSLDSLQTAQNTLNDLTKGTREWKEAVLQVNQQVLDLIDKYPELAKYISNEGGVLSISEEGMDAVLDSTLKKAEAKTIEVMQGQEKVADLELQKYNKDKKGKLEYTTSADYWKIKSDKYDGVTTYSKVGINENTDKAFETAGYEKETRTTEHSVDFNKVWDVFEKANKENAIKDGKLTEDFIKKYGISDDIAHAIEHNVDYLYEFGAGLDAATEKTEAYSEMLAQDWVNRNKKGYDEDFSNAYATGIANVADKFIQQATTDIGTDQEKIYQEYAKFSGYTVEELKKMVAENADFFKTMTNTLISERSKELASTEIDSNLNIARSSDTYGGLSAEGKAAVDQYIVSGGDISSIDAITNPEVIKEVQNFIETLPASLANWIGSTSVQEAKDLFNNPDYLANAQKKKEERFDQKQSNLAKQNGMDVEGLEKLQNTMPGLNKLVEEHNELAIEATENMLEWSKDGGKVVEALDDQSEALKNKDDVEGYAKALHKVATATSEWLDMDVDSNFVEEHLDLITKAANGSKEAMMQLRKEAAEDYFIKLNPEVDQERLSQAISTIYDELGNLEVGDINLFDHPKILEELYWLIDTMGFSADEAAKHFKDRFNIDIPIEYEEVPYSTTAVDEASGDMILYDEDGNEVKRVSSKDFTQYNQEGLLRIPKIGDMSKAQFGGLPTNKPSIKSNKTKGSGGSKKDKKKASKEIERYHEETRTLSTLEKQLDRISKAKDKAFGIDKLKLMDEEIAKYEEMAAAQQDMIDAVKANYDKDRAAAASIGAQFDPNTGEITNWEELRKKALDKFNNSGRTEKDEEEYNRIKEILDQYEETHDKLMEEEDKLKEYLNSIMDAKIAKIQYKAEVKIDFEDKELEYLEYLLSRIEDKAFSTAEAMANLSDQAEDWLDKYNIKVEELYDMMKLFEGMTLDDAIGLMTGNISQERIKELGLSEDQVKKFQELGSDFIDIANGINAVKEAMNEKLTEAIDEGLEKFGDLGDEIDHVAGTLEHYRNLINIIGQDALGISAEQMIDLMGTAVDNGLAAYQNSLSTIEYLNNSRQDILARMANASEEEKAVLQKELDDLDKKIRDAEANSQQSLESYLNMVKEEFSIYVQQAAKEFEKAVSGTFGSLDALQEAFDRQKTLDDTYLDDYKQIYELTKLTRDISKSMDEVDGIKGKQALKKLQQEINDLQKEGVKLSEYDLNHLRAKYELELAQIALEDAQNAKSQVRMTRDSEGNWSYTYTADEDSIANAEQAYEDKLYAMQEMNQEYIKNLEEQLIQSMSAMSKAIQELGPQATQEQIQATMNFYRTQQEQIQQQMNNALGDGKDIWNYMENYNAATGYGITSNEAWVDSFDETQFSILTGFETLEEYQAAFGTSVNTMMDGVDTAFNKYGERLKEAGIDTENWKNKLDETLNGDGGVKDQIEDFEKESEELVTTTTENVGKAIAELGTFYDELGKKMEDATGKTWGLEEAIKALQDAEPKEEPKPATQQQQQTGSGNTSSWEKVKSGYDAIHTGQWGNGNARKTAALAAGFTEQEYQLAQKLINLVYGGMSMSDAKKALGFASGGYTGAWGSSGKLAFLHEKELVLNAEDTQNMLKSIEMVRAIAQTIDLNSGSTLGWGGLSSMGVGNGKSEIVQDITINAEFPNATDQNEIKAAFDSLFIRASQYANRK